MKKSNIIWGLLLVILGVVLGLNALNITNINIFFTGWWTLFLIIPALIGLVEDKDKKGNLILLIVGIILLLAARNIIDFAIVGRLIIPIVLVLLGLLLVFRREDKNFVENNTISDEEEVSATFSDQTITIDGDFSNRKASAAFGRLTLDLSKAKIKKEASIKVEAVFGSVIVILPEGFDLKLKTTPIFGGVSNNYKSSGNKEIYITADAVFGGVTIK